MKLIDWLREEPFSLALSSGYFGFYAHSGFLAALEEAQLIPQQIGASSAGALAGGCWASGLDAESIKNALFSLRRDDFWDPALGAGILRGNLFDERLRTLLKVHQIEHCRIPLAISVFDVLARKTEFLASGDLGSAIRASCAVPVLFHPVWIQNKPYLDGGIADKAGLKGLKNKSRVLYHHLLPKKWWHHVHPRRSAVPKRVGMQVIAIEKLPKVSPFNLKAGQDAFAHAYKETNKSLYQPIQKLL